MIYHTGSKKACSSWMQRFKKRDPIGYIQVSPILKKISESEYQVEGSPLDMS